MAVSRTVTLSTKPHGSRRRKSCRPGRGIVTTVTWLTANPIYGLPSQRKRLIDRTGIEGAPAVVYPASWVGSGWPVPTWNLRAPTRQSLQRASALRTAALPAELSASVGAGVTLVAMMGDRPLHRRWWG